MRRINYSLTFKVIVVWRKPDNTYYYRIINRNHDHRVGYMNGYGHEIVLIIDIFDSFFHKEKLKKVVIRKLISFLHRLEE